MAGTNPTTAANVTGEDISFFDIDNDGNKDLISGGFSGPITTNFVYRLSNGDGTFGSPVSVSNGNDRRGGSNLVVADLNGDGYAEVITQAKDGGGPTPFGFNIFSFNGTSFDHEGRFETSSPLTEITDLAVVDMNGDGTQDIVLGTNGGGMQYFANNTDVITTTTTTTTTTNTVDGQAIFPDIDISTQESARQTLDQMRDIQEKLAISIGQLGAEQSRLFAAYNVISTKVTNVLEAGARIDDADIAPATAQSASSQIRVQAASSLVGQANQSPRLLLGLLEG